MKKWHVWFALLSLGFLPACASPGAHLAIQPVGPRSSEASSRYGQGYLVVYSALSPFNNYDTTDHSGYAVLSTNGKLVRRVHNHIIGDFTAEPPTDVRLPAGRYVVKAESQDYGILNVPVVIRSGETTQVYLDCSSQPANLLAQTADTVRLPDGQIIGWADGAGENQTQTTGAH